MNNSTQTQQKLSLTGSGALGTGVMIGAGIFTLTASTAGNLAGPSVSLAFVLAAVACALAALCYAEFASTVPVAGSAYTFSYATFGELIAWIIGWDLIIEYAVGNIAVAVSWGAYFQTFLQGFGLGLPPWLATDPRTASQAFEALQAGTPRLAANCLNIAALNLPQPTRKAQRSRGLLTRAAPLLVFIALFVYLDDVYWAREGRASIDAAALARFEFAGEAMQQEGLLPLGSQRLRLRPASHALAVRPAFQNLPKYPIGAAVVADGMIGTKHKSNLELIAQGVANLVKNLEKSLESLNVKRIDAQPGTVFNPELHEAIQIDEDAEGDKEIIAEELQAGYMLAGSPIRHAMVKVTRTKTTSL